MPSPFFASTRPTNPPTKTSTTLSPIQEQRIHTLLQEAFSRHDRCQNPLLDTIQQTIDTGGRNCMYGNHEGQGTQVVLDEKALWGVERRLEVFILKQGGKVPGLEDGKTNVEGGQTKATESGQTKAKIRENGRMIDFVDGEMVFEETDDGVSDDSEAWDATISTEDEEPKSILEEMEATGLDEEEVELMFD